MNSEDTQKNPFVQELLHRSKDAVRQALREQLEQMAFGAFSRIMKRMLYRSGYLAVQPTGRKHKRGKTRHGGLDLTARSMTELASSLTLVQLKQYRRTVSRRFVDELRGAMLRRGADQGLLLTLSRFSKVAHQAATDSSIAPIRLIEGEEILDLLFAYRIGVFALNDRWCLDRAYLESLALKSLSLDFFPERAIGTSALGKGYKETANMRTDRKMRIDKNMRVQRNMRVDTKPKPPSEERQVP
jgi:restriction endonuclease Mrr